MLALSEFFAAIWFLPLAIQILLPLSIFCLTIVISNIAYNFSEKKTETTISLNKTNVAMAPPKKA